MILWAVLVGIIQSLASFIAKRVLKRVSGTADDSVLERAKRAKREYDAADQRLQEANARGDKYAKAVALSDLNRWRAELHRLRDEAAAQRD